MDGDMAWYVEAQVLNRRDVEEMEWRSDGEPQASKM